MSSLPFNTFSDNILTTSPSFWTPKKFLTSLIILETNCFARDNMLRFFILPAVYSPTACTSFSSEPNIFFPSLINALDFFVPIAVNISIAWWDISWGKVSIFALPRAMSITWPRIRPRTCSPRNLPRFFCRLIWMFLYAGISLKYFFWASSSFIEAVSSLTSLSTWRLVGVFLTSLRLSCFINSALSVFNLFTWLGFIPASSKVRIHSLTSTNLFDTDSLIPASFNRPCNGSRWDAVFAVFNLSFIFDCSCL